MGITWNYKKSIYKFCRSIYMSDENRTIFLGYQIIENEKNELSVHS